MFREKGRGVPPDFENDTLALSKVVISKETLKFRHQLRGSFHGGVFVHVVVCSYRGPWGREGIGEGTGVGPVSGKKNKIHIPG